MGFFSDPYGQQQLREGTNPALRDRILKDAAQNKFTGEVPLPGESYRFENGNIVEHKLAGGGWKKFAVTAAAIVGGGIAAGGGLAGAGATTPTAGGTTLGEVGPLSSEEAFTAGPVAGTGLSGVDLAGMGAAAKTPSLLHDLLPTIIGSGATLAGTGIAAHANTEASKLQAAQADKALEIQKEQYALQRQDTAPYRALGQGAVGNLGFLAGIDTQAAVPALSSTVPTTPYGQSATPPGATPAAAPTSLGSLGRTQPAGTPDSGTAVSRGSSGLVSVRNPATGLVHLIPADQVSAAQQRGGQLV